MTWSSSRRPVITRLELRIHLSTIPPTQPELIESYRSRLWKLLADGVIRPHHTVFAVDRLDEAIGSIEERRNTGRVALRMDTSAG